MRLPVTDVRRSSGVGKIWLSRRHGASQICLIVTVLYGCELIVNNTSPEWLKTGICVIAIAFQLRFRMHH
jgi:hypothetical protein